MNKLTIIAATFAMSALAPAIAQAAQGFATANVNLRAGPSTQYPAVTVIPEGARLDIGGCMRSANWCDVNYRGIRGWVSASYLQASYRQQRVHVGPQYYSPLGIPNVTFSVGSYWDRNYRGRDFYRERNDWDNNGNRHHRRDARPERRDDARPDPRDVRREPSRDDRKEVRRDDHRNWKRDGERRGERFICPPGMDDCTPPQR
ncbi:SH3 domain-containing protein [Agrobacterium sp. ES01]|uniref:SH3 domain-containing protein n=1 Tax=Agrobacterium sp. ES01 TaxID=3420714 RepID=UPI003D0C5E3D